MHVTKPLNLDLLTRELTAAGVVFNGLQLLGPETSAELTTFTPTDPDGNAVAIDLPPEAVPVVDAHDARKPDRTAAFERAEDDERLALVNARAAQDPAYAALADLTLGRQGRTS